MEVGEEDAATGSKDQNLLAKGKRKTKRQRLQISLNPNFTESDSELRGQRHSFNAGHSNFSSSPSNGGDDEEEDMANCLILLAQGPPPSEPSSSFRRFMEAAEDQNGKYQQPLISFHRNRPFLTSGCILNSGAGKAGGCCVYECKTCRRTFPSFQALGGHRTSHKKPLNPISDLSREKEQEFRFNNNISKNPLELEPRLSRSECYKKWKMVNKLHECSICGAEFTSGQALGGHMRRHRRGLGPSGGGRRGGESSSASMEPPKKQRSLLCLGLDLNLPAPQDDDRREQSGAIVMAAPALVGCHY